MQPVSARRIYIYQPDNVQVLCGNSKCHFKTWFRAICEFPRDEAHLSVHCLLLGPDHAFISLPDSACDDPARDHAVIMRSVLFPGFVSIFLVRLRLDPLYDTASVSLKYSCQEKCLLRYPQYEAHVSVSYCLVAPERAGLLRLGRRCPRPCSRHAPAERAVPLGSRLGPRYSDSSFLLPRSTTYDTRIC